ncbi:hypothetical protein Pmar_PMAR027638 [Perkinsus marinus ATCC 50983]|uniref:Uncharacterized protein n=1 Tax=Perkinsus marinus (strain ATCC 50983 / TXsc) TaxID=423536 RepID=C5KCA9_PERM5|nr:hypothetical protein Pmar_PMAR027638 [Perkinsus marinus ATCC 50983]EER17922.1 hypothetical protein Pmar_PMAR027638 [Perkinsus marinus ATCC 50983]|eukprot:XP_002786126.1 hypothetical protein Pmar_PMAR027638 [Perkinsus marinus ATCC 50983]
MPFTEPRRKRNRTREIAIHRRLCIAANEKKFRAATVKEAMVINEVVLVDKKAGSKDSSLTQSDICSMSDEQIKARFRVTLDLRRLNAMQLVPKTAPDKSGGYVTIDANGVECLWVCTVLPQGWRYSAVLFSRVVGSVLEEACIICKKMGLASGDMVDFCGVRCYRSEIFPNVKRPALTTALIEESCTDFERFHDLEQRKSWIRSWAEAKVILRRLQRLDPRSSKATSLVKELARYYLSGLVCLYVLGNGEGCQVAGTAIMVDCNKDAWAAIMFQLIIIKKSEIADIGPRAIGWHLALDGLAIKMCSEISLELADDEICMLLPLSLDGGSVTDEDMLRSSTFRERKAQLLALHRFLPLCTSPVVMIGDNANSVDGRYWHTLEADHAATELDLRMVTEYHRTVDATLWVPRLSVVKLVDSMARVLPQDLASGDVKCHCH